MKFRRFFLKKLLLYFLFFFSIKIKAYGTLRNSLEKQLNEFNNTNVVFDPIFLKYHLHNGHPEDPRRIQFINEAFKLAGLEFLFKPVNKNINPNKWIFKIHSLAHFNSIKTSMPLAFEVAINAVRAVIDSVDDVMTGKKRNIFCAVRPPGHHALNTGTEEGFCYFSNVAIAAKYAQIKYGIKKILIVDWDYHHGNSTEYFFYDDPSVLFFSTHDQFAYPQTGDPRKEGSGDGKGYNINIHLPCGTSDKQIIDVFKKKLIPIADKFKPELIFISAGFDSRKNDPLGCFEITDSGFEELTKIIMDIAFKYSNDRLISVLEGGYNLKGNAKAALAHTKLLLSYKGNKV